MIATTILGNVWVILVWFHISYYHNTENCYLHALNLQRLPFLPTTTRCNHNVHNNNEYGTRVDRGGATTASVPRKYRNLDVQEEYAREQMFRQNHMLPYHWLGRIRNRFINKKHIGTDDNTVNVDARELSQWQQKGESIISSTSLQLLKSIRTKKNQCIVSNVQQLREKIIDEQLPLQAIQVECPYTSANATVSEVLQHDVIQLMVARYHSQSKPSQRHTNDTAYLALAIEGGGVRGAVCSGMAAAIATLGLTDSFDTVIGSSAGSVIGAYMVSRQMCVDVYLDILPAAKQLFACIKRLLHSISVTALDVSLSKLLHSRLYQQLKESVLPKGAPGMNISFVLDGIMNDQFGLRPLDMKSFRINDQRQPLRVASSYAQNGKLYSKCFTTENFFQNDATATNQTIDSYVTCVDGRREGLFACLEASMTVPGAAGDPVRVVDKCSDKGIAYFDAFCFEPLPYRSAVEVGATHVLVLCSRPEGFQPKTVPGLYERGVANMYFQSHNESEVANFFEQGGQQYIYAEDLLTLEEGKLFGMKNSKVHVPPPTVLYGVNRDPQADHIATNRDQWKEAYLLPLKVPIGTKELPSLEQDRDAVGEAVRGGFAAAFDLLAPAIGIELDHNLTGMDVAKLLFPPDALPSDFVLEHQLHVKGDYITMRESTSFSSPMKTISTYYNKLIYQHAPTRIPLFGNSRQRKGNVKLQRSRAEHLLQSLPGFACGRMAHLAIGLKTHMA